jgi:hypothetical protein
VTPPRCIRGAALDEHLHVQALAQHGVDVQETDREDPGGLGVQELPPGGARAARRRIDARGVQDLPDGGRRHGDAELHQLALDPPMAPQRILPRQEVEHGALVSGDNEIVRLVRTRDMARPARPGWRPMAERPGDAHGAGGPPFRRRPRSARLDWP